ncbi:MAG TPA: hypothetical protein VFO05_14055 [Candidatus Limnocylindrales bacterium]|nr:hypothetical protein [Candidatus Limnocylindrales bacterium]
MVDVDRLRRIERPRRTLECTLSPIPSADLEEVLLDLEMTCVGQVVRARRPAERHRKGLAEREAEGDPQLDGQTEAETALDHADPWL